MTENLHAREAPGATARARWARGATLGLLFVVVVLSALFAYAFLFTTFRIQDDEGYFLLALRAYRAGSSLYGDIDTIYGPFYFQAVAGLFGLLHMPFDNDTARWFVLGAWVLSCLGLLHCVRRITGSLLAGLLAYALAFPLLNSLVSSPLHPGSLILCLIAVLVIVMLRLTVPATRTGALAACGVLTAAITLSKMNAGAFVLFAFVAFFGRFAPRTRAGRLQRTALAVLLPLLPFVLMAAKLGDGEFLRFAMLVSLALVPFSFLVLLDSEECSSPPIAPYLWGGASLTVAVLALCLATGSTLSGMWSALVVGTLRFPASKFAMPPQFEFGAEISVVLAATAAVFSARFRWMSWIRAEGVSIVKLVGGLAILVLCFGSLSNCMRALPLVWLMAVPGTTPKRDLEVRTLFAFLVVLLALHAYPVAGNQAVPFAFLLPAAGVVTVWDSFSELPMPWRLVLSRTRWKTLGVITVITTLAVFHSTLSSVPGLAKLFIKGVPLDLQGAESLRLSERRAAELEWASRNLAHHGDTLVGLPGMHSFYGWTSMVPPVPFYPNTWILFYDEPEREKLVQALLAARRPCLLRNRAAIEFWTGTRKLDDGPWSRTLDREFRVAGAVGEFEVLIPSSARPDLLLSILPDQVPRALIDRFKADRVLRLTFPILDGVHVTRILVRNTQRSLDLFDSAAADPKERVTIVNAAGDDLLRPGTSDSIDLSRRSDVFMICPPDFEAGADSTLVRAYDERARVVARLLVPTETHTP